MSECVAMLKSGYGKSWIYESKLLPVRSEFIDRDQLAADVFSNAHQRKLRSGEYAGTPSMIIIYRKISIGDLGDSTGKVDDHDHNAGTRPSEEWSLLDALAVTGIILLILGFGFALFSDTRFLGVVFPVGAFLMAISGYLERRRDNSAQDG